MTPMDDPQLAEVFAEEIRERADRLVRHARAWARGDWQDETAEEAQRDAHTIKGNAAFVGDAGLTEAASLLEQMWTQIRSGARVFDDSVASALVAASGAILAAAVSGAREAGSLAAICRMLGAENPFIVHELTGEEETFYALARDLPDLGGLVVDEAPHFLDEISPIDSARFGRLVDVIAQQRLDTEALIEALQDSLQLRAEGEWRAATDNLLDSVRGLFEEAAALTLHPASQITSTLGQLVRYISRRSGKDVVLEVIGGEILADRYILDVLREPIRHLVVNAVEHGIERPAQRLASAKQRAGRVTVSFADEDDVLSVWVTDDGRGIGWASVAERVGSRGLQLPDLDRDSLTEALFSPAFTTLEVPTQFSGDGSGLGLVSRTVSALAGAVQVSSSPSEGTTVLIRVPRLRSMQRFQVITSEGQRWGIPAACVVDVLETGPDDVVEWNDHPALRHGRVHIPYATLGNVLGEADAGYATHALVVATLGTTFAIGVSGAPRRVAGLAKQLGPSLVGVDLLSGAALLGGGDVVAMLDAGAVGRAIRGRRTGGGTRPEILVVDDSRAARQLLAASLTSAGFRVAPFAGGLELLNRPEMWRADLIITDIQMPDYDGLRLIGDLRARGVTTPIVVLSGVASSTDLEQALEYGADLVFEKADLRQGAFVAAVWELVKKRAQTTETQPKEAP